MQKLFKILESEYGIVSNTCRPVPGGFSTKASYHVIAANGVEYFLKIYDKTLPTVLPFIKRIDAYMPTLHRLSLTPALHGRILTPIPALSGAYKAETEYEVLVVFLYIKGDVPGIDGMTPAQTIELAETLALLHDSDQTGLIETTALAEDRALLFCGHLLRYLENPRAGREALTDALLSHSDILIAAIEEAFRLRDSLRFGYETLVLCHGDAHGNNVIQSNRLVLADWEDLRLAPAEADLFIHAWHPYGRLLLESYCAVRRDYQINDDLLFFYTLRRRLEDVWVDIERLTEETPDERETIELLRWIRFGIEEIKKLCQTR
ncbi:MAG: aminoglycoside phosphotransferase family protein [Clostridiales bacterium]|nr:aminoglycoside phosphotransferase family protein [Clostridiales bacterium]